MANIGSADRMLRFIFGVALVLLPFLPPASDMVANWGSWKYALTAIGVVMIATAALRFCPAYTLLGIRTCPAPRG